MNWIILILLSVITYSISVILQKLILKENKSDPVVFSFAFQITTGLIIWLYAGITHQLIWQPTKEIVTNLIGMTLLYGMGNILIFKGLQLIEASKFTILFATRAIFTIAGSTLLLGEALQNIQYLGASLILLGIILVNTTQKKLSIGKKDLYVIMGAICFGIANTNDRYLLSSLNLYQFVILAFLMPGLFVGFVYLKRMTYLRTLIQNQLWKKILILSTVYAASAVLFFAALQATPNSSQVAAINLTSTIMIAIMGITLLKERSHMLNKIIGAGITFLGLLLVTR